MNDENARAVASYLNAIQSAVAAVALAVLAMVFVSGGNDEIGLILVLGSAALVIHSFVPPVVHYVE